MSFIYLFICESNTSVRMVVIKNSVSCVDTSTSLFILRIKWLHKVERTKCLTIPLIRAAFVLFAFTNLYLF